ncbi:MAG: AAA family ATPase [Desulfovibrio sp.]|nr:AAA family ATPase [Desulfovibrio sp.]
MLFDNILTALEDIFLSYDSILSLRDHREFFYINRDMRGRASLVWDAASWNQMDDHQKAALKNLCTDIANKLGKHALPAARMPILGAAPFTTEQNGAVVFTCDKQIPFTVVDRMLTESSWSKRAIEDSLSPKMIVFYSIKGGVGRSTALAVAAWHLAQRGKRVLVMDMDLESPGLSSSLLPEDRRPDYGLLDWLVEDVVENGDDVLDRLFASSPLADGSRGEIVVIPAHGRQCNEYIAKMGRAWMHRMKEETRIPWPQRLRSLLYKLDEQHHPDFIFIDARAGLDEIASASVLDLAPRLVLLFALEGTQTWTGYSILFNHWNRIGQARNIRTSLQMVAAMIPPLEDKRPYIQRLRENSWNCFMEQLYDALPTGEEETGDAFSFDRDDVEAPHTPWIIHWHQGLSAMKQLHTLENALDTAQIHATFPFLSNLDTFFFGDRS